LAPTPSETTGAEKPGKSAAVEGIGPAPSNLKALENDPAKFGIGPPPPGFETPKGKGKGMGKGMGRNKPGKNEDSNDSAPF